MTGRDPAAPALPGSARSARCRHPSGRPGDRREDQGAERRAKQPSDRDHSCSSLPCSSRRKPWSMRLVSLSSRSWKAAENPSSPAESQSTSTCLGSSSVSMLSAPIGRSGWAMISSTRTGVVVQHAIDRRRLEKVGAELEVEAQSVWILGREQGQVELRSPARESRGVRSSSGACSSGGGAFWRANITWKSGCG